MAFELGADEPIRNGLRRLARKEVKRAAAALNALNSDIDTAIHDARRRIKKTRAILAMVDNDDGRGTRKDRKRLRKISRTLSPFRDARAKVDVFDRIRTRFSRALPEHTFAIVRRQLVREREVLTHDRTLRATLTMLASKLEQSRRSVKRWRPAHRNFRIVSAALTASRQDCRRKMARARKSRRAADFHEWRKVTKKLFYELRLLEPCGASIRSDVRALEQIETWLGEDHNVTVLCGRLFRDRALLRACGSLDKLGRAAARYQSELRRKAEARAKAALARTDRVYVREVKRLWKAWRQHATDHRAA
jgi:CHAD domain